MTKIPKNHDLRKILEVLLDDLSQGRLIDDSEVRRIVEAGGQGLIELMLQDNFDGLPEHVHMNKDQRISKRDVPVCVSLVSFVHRLSHHTTFSLYFRFSRSSSPLVLLGNARNVN